MANRLSKGTRFAEAYTLDSLLGAGGSGEVWLAREDALGRDVALKVAHDAGEEGRRRFLDEARALAAVRHPGVVPLLHFGADRATGLAFFAMPVFPGILSDRLAQDGSRLPEADVAALGLAVASALAALHSAGIAHRDLKPSNILIDSSGAPVLADPGPIGGGTRAWAAPEQLDAPAAASMDTPDGAPEGPCASGFAADWHALGLVLYRSLIGELPPPRGILAASVEPPRGSIPRDIRPRPSRGWEPLLVSLLEPDPARRLVDPAAIRRALLSLRRRAVFGEKVRAAMRRLRSRLCLPAIAVACAAVAAMAVMLSRQSNEQRQEQEARAQALAVEIKCVEAPIDRLRSFLDAAIDAPTPGPDGLIRVGEGRVLLTGELPQWEAGATPAILLDGGTLFFGPPKEALGGLEESMRERVEILRSTGDPDAPLPPVAGVSCGKVYFPCPVLVTAKGGGIVAYDEVEGYFFVTNAVARAPGVDAATLKCDGFSSLVLNRLLLDPGLTVTGLGSVAEFTDGGRRVDRRWFDPDDPL